MTDITVNEILELVEESDESPQLPSCNLVSHVVGASW